MSGRFSGSNFRDKGLQYRRYGPNVFCPDFTVTGKRGRVWEKVQRVRRDFIINSMNVNRPIDWLTFLKKVQNTCKNYLLSLDTVVTSSV